MILSEREIRSMVSECVSRILEAHGAIDDKLEGLASQIVDRLQNGEDSFSLSESELADYYPYKNCPQELNIVVSPMGIKKLATFSPSTSTLKVSKIAAMCNRDFMIEVIMHELTHIVNNSESNNGLFKTSQPNLGDSKEEEISKKISYLFDPSEIAARVTQFKYALKRNKDKKLEYFESVTHMSYMKKLIELVENEELLYTDDWTVVELLLYGRAWKKASLDGKDRELNTSYENFEGAKRAIVKKLTKVYNDFHQKICKIYYDMKNGG